MKTLDALKPMNSEVKVSLFTKIIESYIKTFPNLQFQRGLCESYGLECKYEEGYFRRMLRWICLGDTLYVVTTKKRGSQTS